MNKYTWIWNGKKCAALMDNQGRVIHGTYWAFHVDCHSNVWTEWYRSLTDHIHRLETVK